MIAHWLNTPTLFAEKSALERKRLYHHKCIPVRFGIAISAAALVVWAGTGGPVVVAAAAFLAALVGFGRWVYVVGEADKNRVWWSRRAHAAVAAVVAGVAVWAAIDQAHRTAAGIVVGVLLAADVVGGWGWSLQHADWIQPEPSEPKASGASFNMALVL